MFNYDPVIYSRMLTTLTLAFHIIFATIGVGIPIMIALAEWIGIKRKDPHYILLARRWTRGFVITVAVGVVTGTSIGLQLSLLWPSFMQIAGQAIALPLFMEIFAFFFEAIFLGIYIYTWDRFKNQYIHFLFVIPVVIGSSASAFFITAVNSFMNTPQGFTLEGGKITQIDPIAAMFNPGLPTEISHVLSSAYAASAFVLGAIAAFALLKGRNHAYYKKAVKLTMVAAFIFSFATAVIGDFSGKFLAEYQPIKLAAAEWHFETAKEAPLVIGGILTAGNEIKYGVKIPYALSFLAHGTFQSEVKGLNEFPPDEIPPLFIHYLFDAMVLIGIYMVAISFLFMVADFVKKWNPYRKIILVGIVAAAPLAMFAIEYGWVFAEVGRQPWILYGYMRTSQGATTSEHVGTMFVLFSILYFILAVTVIRVLRKMFTDNPAEKEIRETGLEGGLRG